MRSAVVLAMLAAVAAGCQSSPVGPVLEAAPPVSAVGTATPNTWDSDVELAAWINNGVTTGHVSLEGSGMAARIRVDITQPANLHGPDLDPPFVPTTARVRYRFVDLRGDSASLTVNLRPTNFIATRGFPELKDQIAEPCSFQEGVCGGPIDSALYSGKWVERVFRARTANVMEIKYATISFESWHESWPGPRATNGYVEIDAIALLR